MTAERFRTKLSQARPLQSILLFVSTIHKSLLATASRAYQYGRLWRSERRTNHRFKKEAFLALTALGVVYGDIGTSPLYALKECFFDKSHGVPPDPSNIYGILSLVFWSLTIVITIKYLVNIMRAENQGEGGILALLALVVSGKDTSLRARRLRWLGLTGAALLFADGFITPVISVYGAVEGAQSYGWVSQSSVAPIVFGILVGLFCVQKWGTERIGTLFGPVMFVWFLTIGIFGVRQIVADPRILAAMNPAYAVAFFAHHRLHGFLTLSLVVLAITGGESLYADMGHFGRRPIATAWSLVMLGLVTNYFGQGAWLLQHPTTTAHPFFAIVPQKLQAPFVLLATISAVIASQALISGAYSLCRQLVQQGFCPRLIVRHTSAHHEGQIYVPATNWFLLTGCLLLAWKFRDTGSSGLAAAYGIAVTGTMITTSILFGFWLRTCQHQSALRAWGLVSCFLLVDLAFFAASITKLADGGYIPLGVASVLLATMTSWYLCRQALKNKLLSASLPISTFVANTNLQKIRRAPGTAVVMTPIEGVVGTALMHNFKHNKVLHEIILFVTIVTKRLPEISRTDRLKITEHGAGLFSLQVNYGFMESPAIEDILRLAAEQGVPVGNDVSYFLGRETIIALSGRGHNVRRWRVKIFQLTSQLSVSAAQYFGIPSNRVVELGLYVEL